MVSLLVCVRERERERERERGLTQRITTLFLLLLLSSFSFLSIIIPLGDEGILSVIDKNYITTTRLNLSRSIVQSLPTGKLVAVEVIPG